MWVWETSLPYDSSSADAGRQPPERCALLGIAKCENSGDSILRVLWIDDQVLEGNVEVRALESEGFRVNCAQTGEEALRLARDCAVDAILLDLRLGEESGIDVLDRLVESGVTAPIVVLTGFAEVETAVAAMKLGAADYQMKPLEAEQLAALLRDLVGRRRFERGPHRRCRSEIEWLRVQCDRLDECLTRRQLATVTLPILVDQRLTLGCFFGCAEALRLALTSSEVSPTLVASQMKRTIVRAAGSPLPQHSKLREAILALERGSSRLSQRAFADRIGLSRAYLSHLLKVHTGRKASEWCRGALMRGALRQILQTAEQISQVAYAAGYNHVGQFDRDFIALFGASPTALRRLSNSD